MSRSVLVLNATFEPLSLVSVRRAVVLLLRDKAELVEATERMLHSASQALPEPLVIRLTRYVRLPHRSVPPTRSAVILRDAYTCQYCGDTPGKHSLTVDHVIPRCRGGDHSLDQSGDRLQTLQLQKGRREPPRSRHETDKASRSNPPMSPSSS